MDKNTELDELLNDLKVYMEDKADADFVGESYVPNEEMKFLGRIEEMKRAIEK